MQNRRMWMGVFALSAVALSACPTRHESPTDGTVVTDANDGHVTPSRRSSAAQPLSGAGRMTSASYRMTVAVGDAPSGVSSSAGNRFRGAP